MYRNRIVIIVNAEREEAGRGGGGAGRGGRGAGKGSSAYSNVVGCVPHLAPLPGQGPM